MSQDELQFTPRLRKPLEIMENRCNVAVTESMSETVTSRVLDHLRIVKGGRANACKDRIAVDQMTKDESLYKRYSSRKREERSNFSFIEKMKKMF
ncbi:hypothetical protein AOLI_G00024340 [Acnodon oligacanthus]